MSAKRDTYQYQKGGWIPIVPAALALGISGGVIFFIRKRL